MASGRSCIGGGASGGVHGTSQKKEMKEMLNVISRSVFLAAVVVAGVAGGSGSGGDKE